ncbi:MAG: apolipoprotein N-acyltransferase [Thiothrix sp.]|nr:MAG: apolipoprotein N-acyltransferase [Thiothrix sp.]
MTSSFRGLPRYLLSVIAGGSLVGAFAPLEWWLLGFISPTVLIVLWLPSSSRQALGLGYFFGLGFFGVGVSWVYNSIHEFGHAPPLFAAALTLLFVLVLSSFPAAVGWIQAQCRQRSLRLIVVIPSAWILLEWLRGWIFTGFPWLQLGYSQLDTPLAAIGPVFGVLGIGWVIMLLVGLTVTVVLNTGKARWLALASIVLVIGATLLLQQVEWTRAKDKPISVALIQGNIAQENKWQDEWLLPTIKRYNDLTMKNLDRDLVVWPEVALPGYYKYFKPNVLKPLQRRLQNSETDLLFGILSQEGNRNHNSLMKLGEDTEVYHKRHLVPFGEYIPLRQWLSWLNQWVVLPASNMDSGSQPTLLHAAGEAIAGSICYEDAYGNEMAQMLPTASVLVNVSNDAWFGDSLAPQQHLQIARMRALELGRPMLRATNTGVSAIVNYKGGLDVVSVQFEIDVLKAMIWPRDGATPFINWGNIPVLMLNISLILTAFATCLLGLNRTT